jgi:TonB family protein
MRHGKKVCDTLKAIRLDIARANGIEYAPTECTHKGDCAGTCPACESEIRYLEREIARKRSLGKAALVAGVSLGMMSFTATPGYSHPLTTSDRHDGDEDSIAKKPLIIPRAADDRRVRDEVFGRPPEPMPIFPGGYDAMIEYIKENLHYPAEAAKNQIEGTVLVQLHVGADGKLIEAVLVHSVDPNLDKEALRICKSMPSFEPGHMGDRYVETWMVVPVKFSLEEEE